jgi:hypothetical protein
VVDFIVVSGRGRLERYQLDEINKKISIFSYEKIVRSSGYQFFFLEKSSALADINFSGEKSCVSIQFFFLEKLCVSIQFFHLLATFS